MTHDGQHEQLPARLEQYQPVISETGPRSIATLEAYDAPPPPMREYLSLFQRRRRLILVSVAAVLGLSVLLTVLTPRVYESSATLMISELDPRESRPTEAQSAMSAMGSPNLETHVNLIQGEPTAVKTAEYLAENGGPVLSALQVRQSISAKAQRDTQLIRIAARANRGGEAQKIADAAATSYVALNRRRARGSSETTGKYLEEQLAIARGKLTKAENDLREFREKSGTIAVDADATDLLSHASSLRSSVDATAADLAQIQARAGRIRARLAEQNLSIKTGQVRDNAVIQQLRAKLADLQGQRLAAQAKYTPEFPGPLAQIDEQIRLVKEQLDSEVKHVVKAGGGDLDLQQRLTSDLIAAEAESSALRARLQQLQRDLQQAGSELDKVPARQVTLANLQREVEVAQNVYAELLRRSQEIEVGKVMALGNADVVEPATAAHFPVKPNIPLNLLLGLLLGLGVGAGLALLRDQLDDTIRDQTEASRLAAAPVLGTIPVFQSNGAAGALPPGGPASLAAEAYRALRYCLEFITHGEKGRVVLVTSPGQSEGKTTTVWNLARAVAMTGRKVLLVDADLRRSGLGRLLGMHKSQGLTEVLAGEVSLQEALQKHQETGVLFLSAGRDATHPTEMLDADTMRSLVAKLRQETDLVIMDSPPVLAVADSLVLAKLSDEVLLVCVAGQSHRHEVQLARNLLSRVGERVTGVVVNRVGEKPGYGYQRQHYYYQ